MLLSAWCFLISYHRTHSSTKYQTHWLDNFECPPTEISFTEHRKDERIYFAVCVEPDLSKQTWFDRRDHQRSCAVPWIISKIVCLKPVAYTIRHCMPFFPKVFLSQFAAINNPYSYLLLCRWTSVVRVWHVQWHYNRLIHRFIEDKLI